MESQLAVGKSVPSQRPHPTPESLGSYLPGQALATSWRNILVCEPKGSWNTRLSSAASSWTVTSEPAQRRWELSPWPPGTKCYGWWPQNGESAAPNPKAPTALKQFTKGCYWAVRESLHPELRMNNVLTQGRGRTKALTVRKPRHKSARRGWKRRSSLTCSLQHSDQECGLQSLDSGFEAWFHQLLSYLISLGLGYLTHKIGMRTVITSRSCEESGLGCL